MYLGSLGGALWKETSEERHLESFCEGLSQLLRKHHSATVFKKSTEIITALSAFEDKCHRVLHIVRIGCEPPPKMQNVLRLTPKHSESEALGGPIYS